MNKEEYNGWSNYATWRVNLELIDGGGFAGDMKDAEHTFEDEYELASRLAEYVDDILSDYGEGDKSTLNFTLEYARAFVSDVKYVEIAKSLIESYPELIVKKA